jgi:sugar phosphate permease
MPSIIDILLLGLPLMVLILLVGLGACVAVVAQEGRGRASAVSRIAGLINLACIIPMTMLSWAAESQDVRYMFLFAAGAFALVGLLGLRLPQRYRD